MVYVVTHNAASVDGRIDLLDVDLGTFYGLAGRFEPDAHLVGSDTLIEGMAGGDGGDADAPPESDQEVTGDSAPLLVVPDSRGRIDGWEAVRAQPYWGDPVVLCSETTPGSYLASLDEIDVEYRVVGDDHVDYGRALEALEEDHAVETVLVDSGGTLSGHLFRAGLVDEVSVLVHPTVVGGTTPRPFVRGPDPSGPGDVVHCGLTGVERVEGDLVWLRYSVADS